VNLHYRAVAERAGHRCEYCRAPEAVFNSRFEVEHILATSQQGSDDDTNLTLACRSCNLLKSDHRHAWDEFTKSAVWLFNPRQDRWEEHFQVIEETGLVQGTTAVGRATIACLRLNSQTQIEARRLWMHLGLFP
jgi:HNH endonuclease